MLVSKGGVWCRRGLAGFLARWLFVSKEPRPASFATFWRKAANQHTWVGKPEFIQDAWYDGSTCNVPWYAGQALTITGHFAWETGSIGLSASEGLFSSSMINEIDDGRSISIRIASNGVGAGAHNRAIVGYDTTVEGMPLLNPAIDI